MLQFAGTNAIGCTATGVRDATAAADVDKQSWSGRRGRALQASVEGPTPTPQIGAASLG